MSKSCQGRYNEATQRWEATYQGKVIASNRDRVGGKDYLRQVIEISKTSTKAKNLGITSIEFPDEIIGEDGQVVETAEDTATVEKEFPINERFMIMEDYVDMVAKGELPSTLVTGEGGLGKTHTVMKTIKASGLQDINKLEIGARLDGVRGFVVVKGYSTPKGLFRTLFENRNQTIIFDDCDSVLKDPNAVNVLKAALDSYDTRIVSWNAEGFSAGDDLPRSFEFTGGVIFISNMDKNKIPQAIRSRAMCADVGMTRAEVIERMRSIVTSPEFMPEFEQSHKVEALEFVAENAYNPIIQEINLRSLVNVIKARASKPNSWKRMGLYSMANA